MKVTAIIDSYNYVDFLPDAINSVLSQNHLPDELIVVDDGSTDGSYELAERLLKNVSWARVISKPNGGQLSCISLGIAESTGDIIAFLDCDDYWREDHLEKALPHFNEHAELSLYFSACQRFNSTGNVDIKTRGYTTGLIGRTFATTAAGMSYVGTVNSALIARSSYLKPYLPVPKELEKDWKINADNVIVWITSLAGGLKYSSPEPTLHYRLHEKNQSIGAISHCCKTHRQVARMRLFKYFSEIFYIPEDIAKALAKEFRAHQNSSKMLKKEYLRALCKNYCNMSTSQYWQHKGKIWMGK